MGPIIFLAILAAAVACGIGVRRGLVTLQHDVAAAWSDVDDLLTQRHDRLPELFEASERHQPGKRDALARAGNDYFFLVRSQQGIVYSANDDIINRIKRELDALGAGEKADESLSEGEE